MPPPPLTAPMPSKRRPAPVPSTVTVVAACAGPAGTRITPAATTTAAHHMAWRRGQAFMLITIPSSIDPDDNVVSGAVGILYRSMGRVTG